MNISPFSVAQTNIFPIVNSKAGGQYVTEFNLRSRESVATDGNIQYFVGPSYAHGPDDFELSISPSSSAELIIGAGSCLLNGHYVQSLTPVSVNILELNKNINEYNEGIADPSKKMSVLKGNVCIGLQAIYSTEITMSGSLLVEDSDGYYQGIQVVVLPKSEFITPAMSPKDPNKVTAHLKLGEFFYANGGIRNLVNDNAGKCYILDASRISNINDIVAGQFITKNGLNANKIYTFAGKPSNVDTNSWKDYWCDSTDCLMIWDAVSKPVGGSNVSKEQIDNWKDIKQAQFKYDKFTDTVNLIVPHKQVSDFTTTVGNELYYPPMYYDLPKADYESGDGGVVDKEYTRHIKAIQAKFAELYNLPGSEQRAYIHILNSTDDLPPINPQWKPGDYIIVGIDNTVNPTIQNVSQGPSTMYVVLPGLVQTLYLNNGDAPATIDVPPIDREITGVELGRRVISSDELKDDSWKTDSGLWSDWFGLPSDTVRGQVNTDYFVLQVNSVNKNGQPASTKYYYFTVDASGDRAYSNPPILLTGNIQLATENMIGGFLNCNETNLGAGYVMRDGNGHLRLLDYSFLSTGVLAYQLGEDWNIGNGLSFEEIQAQLDDYINDRVAFANDNKANSIAQNRASSISNPLLTDPYTINVTINIPSLPIDSVQEVPVLTIKDIDSRFNTAVNLTLTGSSVENVILDVINCEKIRIQDQTIPAVDDNGITAPGLRIRVSNCCLYYDSVLLSDLVEIDNISFWYKQYSLQDPDLFVDGMNIVDNSNPSSLQSLDYWTYDSADNDNHFSTALKSVRFNNSGNIIGFGIYIKNDSTSNNTLGKAVFASSYSVPQGTSLSYPLNRLINRVKIDGSFVTSYPTTIETASSSTKQLMIQDISFTILSNIYDRTSENFESPGTISFLSDSYYVENLALPTTASGDETYQIDGWASSSYHQFEGSTVI